MKQREGNRRKVGKRHLRPDARGIGRPQVPKHLLPEERQLFEAIVRSLPVELMTRADESTLEQMAVAWARFRRACKVLRDEGEFIKSERGLGQHPAQFVMRAASKDMTQCGTLLGLSPVARARLTSVSPEMDDPMAALLGMDNDPDGAWSTPSKAKH